MFETMPELPAGRGKSAPEPGAAACEQCGWNFEVDNAKRIAYDPEIRPRRWRREPRTEIRIRGHVFCDVCYERGLWRNEAHSVQGGAAAGLYREALFLERGVQGEAEPTRESLGVAMGRLLSKIEAAP